ncbi:uncharacterized protein BKA55DRAFT_701570 [Fusarium redolens]|uniref:Uncharacterized protein n=1 Tax=Fusarium redolens TaxID=48865 RepID=A0A9P9GYN7_FUSRE|nr:uncharacterized protein BKA55DRAFT_701570 [Fusarium redolens]KAH7247247.1 hypothetical protein BKA55DRAFT_701570 [Fusarium redolens]
MDPDDDDATRASVESDVYLAKRFLERTWERACRCEKEGEENDAEQTSQDEQQGRGLLDIADYWRNLEVPDSIGNASPRAEADANDLAHLNWSSILSGGGSCPKLDIQSPQFGAYVFFLGISHIRRTTTYLTSSERRTWINELLLPAIRHCCPPDVTQHHPRSFDGVESKAYSRKRETCGGMVHNKMDMHHYLPHEYLQQVWHYRNQHTERPEHAIFRGMFIVLSAKNIKLEAKSPTLQRCRPQVVNHLQQLLDWSKANLSNTWVDVGIEDTAFSEKCTFLFKSRCLKSWAHTMRNSTDQPLMSSEHFNWNLTSQAGSARMETRRSHPLRKGGIAYAQRYNVNKDLFSTASKRDGGLFSEPNLEGLTCPISLLDAWIVAARQYRNAGLATSAKSEPKLKRFRKALQAMKARIGFALPVLFLYIEQCQINSTPWQ